MKKKKEAELDCSKKCTHVISDCEAEGGSRDSCENRYSQCVSKCAFA